MTKVSSYTYLCVLRYPYEICRSENEDYQSYSYIKVIRFYDFFSERRFAPINIHNQSSQRQV